MKIALSIIWATFCFLFLGAAVSVGCGFTEPSTFAATVGYACIGLMNGAFAISEFAASLRE